MKRLGVLWIRCVFAVAVAQGAAYADTLEFSFDFNPDQVIYHPRGVGYELPELEGCQLPSETPGAPWLPVRYVNILLPDNAMATGLVCSVQTHVLRDDVRIYPEQPPCRLSSPQPPQEMPPDPIAYAAARYPDQNAVLLEHHTMRGQTFVTVRLNPFTYRPLENRLTLATNLMITLFLDQPGIQSRARTNRTPPNSGLFHDILNGAVINPAPLEDESRPTVKSLAESCDYLIITSAALSNAFQRLADFRATHNGLSTRVLTLEDIYASYSGIRPDGGIDNQTRIRNAIKHYVDDHGTVYVVLGGDVPVRGCYVAVYGWFWEEIEENMPTDLYYAGLDGTWDENANGIYGEADWNQWQPDEGDLAPDVILSRIPIGNASQADGYINKLVAFETESVVEGFSHKLFLGGNMGWKKYSGDERVNYLSSDGEIGDGLSEFLDHDPVSDTEIWTRRLWRDCIKSNDSRSVRSQFYDTLTSWDTSTAGDNVLNAANMQARLNEGWNHVIFNTHGNDENWSLESGYYTANNAASLTNTTAFINTVACDTGAFDAEEPSLSEAFLRNENGGGALVYLGCSRAGWGTPYSYRGGASHEYEYAFINLLYNEKCPIVGMAFNRHKLAMAGSSGYNGDYRWIQFGLNMQGEPLVPLFRPDNWNIAAVDPSYGSWTGGYEVVISGTDLGNGSDITNVTLCGVGVSDIVSQTDTQVVVVAGPALAVGLGAVHVYSESLGEAASGNVFRYAREQQEGLVFDPVPASPQAFASTNTLSVSGGSGTGTVSFLVLSGPGTIARRTNLAVTAGSGTIIVRAQKAQDDLYAAAYATTTVEAVKAAADVSLLGLKQAYDGTAKHARAGTLPGGLAVELTYNGNIWAPTNAGSYAVTGTVNDANWSGEAAGMFMILGGDQPVRISPDIGPFVGGNQVTVSNFNFGTITQITLGGEQAAIQAYGENWVRFTVPPTESAGVKDIIIQTEGYGDILLADAYEYNLAGKIGWVDNTGPAAWTNLGSGLNGEVLALTHAETNLYVGGNFTYAGGMSASRVAQWNGIGWTNLGSGIHTDGINGGAVNALVHGGTNLYVGGYFTSAGGVEANNIAQWNGTSWTNLGSGTDGEVYALAHDGANLYAGGNFTSAGGRAASCVAMWNGAGWTNLGSGIGSGGTIYALIHDGTNLYAGGYFTSVGGVAVNHVAKWNGASWTRADNWPYGAGLDNAVNALAHDGMNLYAGGEFNPGSNAGASMPNHVGMWNCNMFWPGWTSLASGVDGTVFSLAQTGTNLFAGGDFLSAGEAEANHVAMWNPAVAEWSNLGGGLDNSVWALAHDGTNLYAGGIFTNAGEVVVNHVAMWRPAAIEINGVEPAFGTWTGGYEVVIRGSNLGNGTDITNVTLRGAAAIIQSQSPTQVVVVAGQASGVGLGDVRVFSTSFGETVKSNAFECLKADQTIAFPPIAIQPATAKVGLAATASSGLAVTYAVASGPGHIANGTNLSFTGAGMVSIVASQAGNEMWNPAPEMTNAIPVYALSVYSGPFVGGNILAISNAFFGTITNVLVGGIAATIEDFGTAWVRIVVPAIGSAGATDVVIQAEEGETTLINAYRYNPTGQIRGYVEYGPCVWTNLGSGMNDVVMTLACEGTNLYAGGYFSVAGGVAANHAAKWNGTSWTNLDAGISQIDVIEHDGTNLYAGGWFDHIARWNGASWTNLGGGIGGIAALAHDGGDMYAGGWSAQIVKWNGNSWARIDNNELLPVNQGGSVTICALEHDGTNLYAGGWFKRAGEMAASNIARWNGANWTNLGSGADSPVRALVYRGARLFAGGEFTRVGGVAASHVAQWDGAQWTNLGSGLGDLVFTLAHDGTNLYAGGWFTNAGAAAASNVAKWNGTSWTNLGSGMDNQVWALAHDGTYLYAGGYFTNAGGVAASRIAKWGPAFVNEHSSVDPSSGSWTGGYPVVIRGTNLGSGTDITNVLLRGVAASIQSQSATQVVVTAGQAACLGLGDVRVFSTSYGETVKSNSFEYLTADQTISFPSLANQPAAATVGLAATTPSGLAISFTVVAGPGSIANGTNLTFTGVGKVSIVASQAGDAWWNPAQNVTNVFRVYALSAYSGPFVGGNAITVNGDFGTVTNVLVGGIAANVGDSGIDWVQITLPAAGSAGVKDVVIQAEECETTLANAYTYNPTGQIGGIDYGPCVWTNLGSGISGGTVLALAHDGANLYAGGQSVSVGGPVANSVVKWNGSSWSNYGAVGGNSVSALAPHGDDLVAGGLFTTAGGEAATNIARDLWSGVSWKSCGGVNGQVRALIHDGTYLYAGGSFTIAGNAAASRVAKWESWPGWPNVWDGHWSSLGSGLNGDVYAVSSDGVNLYAGGAFSGHVAQWNGANWVNLGLGKYGKVNALAHNGTILYAGGDFAGVAQWNGSSWTDLGDLGGVNALACNGTNLYAGGAFSGKVARWNGTNWTSLGGGMNSTVWALAHDGVYLYAGGEFTTAGGTAISRIAKWGPSSIEPYFGVAPTSGSWTGGYPVIIRGSNLGNGADITNVTLRGVAASIQSQSSTQVVVAAGQALGLGLGDVRVFSTSFGETVKSNAFEYLKADQTISFPPMGDQSVTDVVLISASASSGLAVSFALAAGPAQITNGTNLSFTGTGTVSIVASQAGDANWNPAVAVTNTFNVIKAFATVTLQKLNQPYNGRPRVVTAVTEPADLPVIITYGGQSVAPTETGLYAVVGTIDHALYQGTVSGTLTVALGTAPGWWTARGIVDANMPANDFAPVNQGQVKWIALQAFEEMEERLVGGAGQDLQDWFSDLPQGDNYLPINVGQLKEIARPFYDRLIVVGYTNQYPWVTAAETNDYAPVNIGQVKNLFSFDLTGYAP